jgi:hypothetical protein
MSRFISMNIRIVNGTRGCSVENYLTLRFGDRRKKAELKVGKFLGWEWDLRPAERSGSCC